MVYLAQTHITLLKWAVLQMHVWNQVLDVFS